MGTSQQLVLHFNEQFRRLDELTDLPERMPDSIKRPLLQNTVKDIPHLNIVETLDEYTSTTSGDGSFTHLNYLSYHTLLINACVQYDATNTSTPSKRRNVYSASDTQDSTIIEEPHETQFSQDIDTPSDDFYQVHQTKHNKKHSKPLSGIQRDHAKQTNPSAPKKPLKNRMVLFMFWQKFTNSSALKLLLPSRNTMLRPSTNLQRKRGIHMTDIADQEPLPSEDTTPEEQHDPHQFDDAPGNESDPIFDYISSKHHQEEDMKNALQAYNVMTSPTSDATTQQSIDSVHIHIFYNVAEANKPNMDHLLIGKPMVSLQGQMSESSPNPPGNALLLVLTNTRSIVWTLCNVLHWSKPIMGMSTSS